MCLDEKPVTLHADVRPASPAEPGREARYDSEYERRGTANVFCAVEPKTGRHFTFQDFMGVGAFLGKARRVSAVLKINHYSNGNLLTDNAGIKVPLTLGLGLTF